MYKLMIVDDEYMILEGLKQLLPYRELGIEIVATFDNAFEALAYFESHQVDAVITDVAMPEMTGLEMIARMKSQVPDLPVLILSGYQEFDYARQALSLGVQDYLVKPVNKVELYRLLEQLIQSNQAAKTLGQDFLKGKHITVQQLKEAFQTSSLYIRASRSAQSNSLVSIERHIGSQLIFFSLYDRDTKEDVLYQRFLSDDDQMDKIKEIVEAILFYGIKRESEVVSVPAYDSYSPWVLAGDVYGLLEYLPQMLLDFETNCPPVHLTKSFFSQLMVDTYHQFNKISTEEIEPLYSQVKASQSLTELGDLVKGVLFGLIGDHQYSPHVKEVMAIIQEEYQSCLSLKAISQRLFLNAVYLGQIIKEETGATFSELLNQQRIRMARTLLLTTDLSVEEICFQVGYTNIGYFYKIFKRFCDQSPKTYRQQSRLLSEKR